jgi:hypothetical protein
MGINWIGSVGPPAVYTKLLPVDLAGGQQETRLGVILNFDLSSGKITR